MLRKSLCLFLLCLLLVQPVYAFSLFDGATQKILRETWDAQTLDELMNGVVAIPQSAINDYLATQLTDYPDIRDVQLAVHPDNQIHLDLNTRKSGRISIDGAITRFVQNNDESQMSVAVGKRKLLDKPVTSWFFAHLSLSLLSRMFGNPLNSEQDKFVTQISGNTLNVNFKPYIDQSPLQGFSVAGFSLINLFSVDSLTTEEGTVYLHTSYHGPSLALPALQRLFE